MKPTVCIFTICWQEALMLPYFLRHYATFADKIIVFDENSTDGSRDIVNACPIAELRDWPGHGLDDNRFMAAVNEWYKEARGKFDWVAWPDIDELLWHPDMSTLLASTKADMLQATGFGMISKSAPSGQPGQIYDHFRTGVRQLNYDKAILWRPSVDVVHQHGRHTYAPTWPKCSGVKESVPELKLLHYHYFGVEHTAARNRRNYARALDKKFAWNFDSNHNNDPKQGGSVAWVQAMLTANKPTDVFLNNTALKKLHLGCGDKLIYGWENHDVDADITKPLPFANNSVSHLFCEHCVEHITHQQAWSFFDECFRVLTSGGIVRIAVPDLARLSREMTQEYQDAVKAGGHGDGSKKYALRAVVFDHGHQAIWSQELLDAVLSAVGFRTQRVECGKSAHVELNDIEQHWKTVGRGVAGVETSVVEGTKP